MNKKRVSEVKFRCKLGDHDVDGIVVNPGGWFGKVYLIQIGIANALNPFFAVEAGGEQEALDEFADSRLSHLIDVPEEDQPKNEKEEENSDYVRAGNDGHWIETANLHIQKAPADLIYFVEWNPDADQDLSSVVDQELDVVRDEMERDKAREAE